MKKRARLALLAAIAAALAIGGVMLYGYLYPAAPKAGDAPVRVACVGDSITYGAELSDRERDAYPAQLGALLGAGYEVLNYGLSGRAIQSDAYFPYTKESFYPLSQEARPDIVLIMLGTNDAIQGRWDAERYERELEAFVGVYQGLDSAPDVYLMTCPPVYGGIGEEIVADEVVPIIARVAARTGAAVIDVHTALSDQAALFPDGLHPDAEGAGVIVRAVYDAIR